MREFKTLFLVTIFNITSIATLALYFLGLKMGLGLLVHPTIAAITAFIYVATFGRYRIRYGLVPGLIGAIADVGLWKTMFFFIAPLTVLLAIAFSISRYGSSFLVGSRRHMKPDFDLTALGIAVHRFHGGAAQDAHDMGRALRN